MALHPPLHNHHIQNKILISGKSTSCLQLHSGVLRFHVKASLSLELYRRGKEEWTAHLDKVKPAACAVHVLVQLVHYQVLLAQLVVDRFANVSNVCNPSLQVVQVLVLLSEKEPAGSQDLRDQGFLQQFSCSLRTQSATQHSSIVFQTSITQLLEHLRNYDCPACIKPNCKTFTRAMCIEGMYATLKIQQKAFFKSCTTRNGGQQLHMKKRDFLTSPPGRLLLIKAQNSSSSKEPQHLNSIRIPIKSQTKARQVTLALYFYKVSSTSTKGSLTLSKVAVGRTHWTRTSRFPG
jgi:hypothetical protein